MGSLKYTILLLPLFCFAEVPSITPPEQVEKLSEAFGFLIAKNMSSLGVDLDMQQVVKGIQEASEGKESPMSEEECIQAIAEVQENLYQKQAKENLQRAETFLCANAQNKGIISLHQGKLQYKIEKPGKGVEVQPHFTPVIRFVGKYLNGEVFGSSKEEEALALDETITGIQEGLIGMKEGEKRTLFIHPDLAYGTNGLLPPNSLLTFEIELVKADGGENLLPAPKEDKEERHEIVSPAAKRETLR